MGQRGGGSTQKSKKRSDATYKNGTESKNDAAYTSSMLPPACVDLEDSLKDLFGRLASKKEELKHKPPNKNIPRCPKQLFSQYVRDQGLLVRSVTCGDSVIYSNGDPNLAQTSESPTSTTESTNCSAINCAEARHAASGASVDISAAAPVSTVCRASCAEHSVEDFAKGTTEASTEDGIVTALRNAFELYSNTAPATTTLSQFIKEVILAPDVNASKDSTRSNSHSRLLNKQTEDSTAEVCTSEPPPAKKDSPMPSCPGCEDGTCAPLDGLGKESFEGNRGEAHVFGGNQSFSGSLPFPGTQRVEFDATCSRIVISDCLASWGSLVCQGRGCIVSFQNVHFERCPVYIFKGAAVTFTGCTFTGISNRNEHEEERQIVAILAAGEGTVVSLADCTFKCGHALAQACDVSTGAKIHVEHCTFLDVQDSAFAARGDRTVLTYRRCVFEGSFPGITEPSCGIVLEALASANVVGCMMRHLQTGLMLDYAHASLTSSAISFASAYCASANSGNLDATDCVFEGATDPERGHGLLAYAGSVVTLTRSHFVRNCRSGIFLRGEVKLTVRDCKMLENVLAGIYVEGKGVQISLVDTVCSSSRMGVHVNECGDCSLCRVHALNVSSMGFWLSNVQSCSLVECKSEAYAHGGAIVSGDCGLVSFERCAFGSSVGSKGWGNSAQFGVHVCGSAEVSAVGCTFNPGAQAVGASAENKGAELALSGCKLTAKHGVEVTQGAVLKMTDCITSNCGSSGINVFSGASGCIVRHTSTSDEIGILCGRASVNVEGCELTNFSTVGVQFAGPSTAECSIQDCKLVTSPSITSRYRKSAGISVDEKRTVLCIRNCSVKGTIDSSVEIRGSAAVVRLYDCELAKSEICGLRVRNCNAKVFLTGCTLCEHKKFGVLCEGGGRVVAERTHTFRNGAAGYAMMETGKMTLSGCSSVEDGQGLLTCAADIADVPVPGLVLKQVLVRKATRNGFLILEGGSCLMQNCCAIQCGGHGMYVRGCLNVHNCPATVTARDCRVQKCGLAGIVCRAGAHSTMHNVVSTRNRGAGYLCAEVGSRLQLFDCKSSRNTIHYECDDNAVHRRERCVPDVPCDNLSASVRKMIREDNEYLRTRLTRR